MALTLAGCARGSNVDHTADGPSGGAAGAPVPLTASDVPGFFGNGVSFTPRGSFGLDHSRLVTDPSAPGGRFLQVSYPKGSASPTVARADGGSTGGAQLYLRFPRSADLLFLRYSVRFPAGFQFVKGGKLPGLFGGSAGSGGNHRDDGFSTRFMWRRDGAGEVYAYFPGATGDGASLGRGSWIFSPGRWAQIEQRVQLNTPGRADGTITVWLDGHRVFHQPDLIFRTDGRLHIDGLFFSTFFGGGDPSWASPVDQHVDFADFTVTEHSLDPPASR